jgi:hypothetical protein
MNSAIALLPAARPSWLAARRIRRLGSARSRARAADALERAINDAAAPRRLLSSAVPVAREAVLDCRAELASLCERLLSDEPVYAQGVALAFQLLTNGDSPLYQSHGDLGLAIAEIVAGLDGHLG